MNTFKLSIPFVLCTFLLVCSCNRFLEEDPRDQISEGEYTSIDALYLNAVASLYNYIGGYEDSQGLQGTTRGIYDFNTVTTDEAMIPTRGGDWYDGGFWQRLYLHSWGVADQSIRNTWEYLFKVIALSNKSLETLQANRNKFDAAQIDTYIAEVRAFRAIYYYYLLDLFARVPIVTGSTVPVNQIRQSQRSEVFGFVVGELLETLPQLSIENSAHLGDYYGRITQPVAYFVLAKVMLNAGIYADDNWTDQDHIDGTTIHIEIDGREYNAWEAVIECCDRISAFGYDLEDNYEDNFAVFNETSVENIFVIPMDKRSYTNQMQYIFRSLHYNHSQALGFSSENGTSATRYVLEVNGYGTPDEDPRFAMNYYAGQVYNFDGVPVNDDFGDPLIYLPWEIALDVSGTAAEKMAGARMKKYAIDRTNIKDGKLIENDIPLFRYADVLLMKSEALVRNGLNGDNELNRVRSRVGATPRRATLETLLDERLIELAWEGHRRQDMIRFGIYHRAYDQRPQLSGEANAYTTVFPIPQRIIEINRNLTQNPGYE